MSETGQDQLSVKRTKLCGFSKGPAIAPRRLYILVAMAILDRGRVREEEKARIYSLRGSS
jgi:hypothetical protein